MTAERAATIARADEQVRELLRGLDDVRTEAEFVERWQVWVVHFLASDRRVGFATVSEDGRVLEVGETTERDAEVEDERDLTKRQRIEELELELEIARAEGNQQEVKEILELLRDLRGGQETVQDEIFTLYPLFLCFLDSFPCLYNSFKNKYCEI